MRESTIEKYLVDGVAKAGGIAYKFTSPQRRSVPDRIILLPCGRVYFVEVKAPGKQPTPSQQREHARIEALGFQVKLIDSKILVDEFLRKELENA